MFVYRRDKVSCALFRVLSLTGLAASSVSQCRPLDGKNTHSPRGLYKMKGRGGVFTRDIHCGAAQSRQMPLGNPKLPELQILNPKPLKPELPVQAPLLPEAEHGHLSSEPKKLHEECSQKMSAFALMCGWRKGT